MINKDVRKSLARKNGNEILIWGWNDSKFKPIYFNSRKLTDVQQRYIVTEEEVLSIIENLKEFRTILLGKKIMIYTNH